MTNGNRIVQKCKNNYLKWKLLTNGFTTADNKCHLSIELSFVLYTTKKGEDSLLMNSKDENIHTYLRLLSSKTVLLLNSINLWNANCFGEQVSIHELINVPSCIFSISILRMLGWIFFQIWIISLRIHE